MIGQRDRFTGTSSAVHLKVNYECQCIQGFSIVFFPGQENDYEKSKSIERHSGDDRSRVEGLGLEPFFLSAKPRNFR